MFKRLIFLACFFVATAVAVDTIEIDPNYPEEQLNRMDLWKYTFAESIRQKRGTDLNSNQFLMETKLCDSIISFKKPQKLRNVNKKWRTIVNHGNYTQFVRFEECSSLNFPCTFNIYPQPVRSFCQQNHHKISLWSMDVEANCLIMDKFFVPSNCDCMIEKEDFFRGVSKDLLKSP